MNVINYILSRLKLQRVLDNSGTLLELCKCFDYAIEKEVPKCFIKLRMATLYTRMFGDSLSECFAGQWFTTLFTTEFSTDLCVRIIDLFLLRGWNAMFRLGLAIIRHNEGILLLDRLLQARFDDVFNIKLTHLATAQLILDSGNIQLKANVNARFNKVFMEDTCSNQYAFTLGRLLRSLESTHTFNVLYIIYLAS